MAAGGCAVGKILFVHGMGHDARRDYWRGWAERLEEELRALGADVGPEDFGGIYYYDLVPHPAAGARGAQAARQRFWAEQRELVHRELCGLFPRSLVGRLAGYLADNFGDIYAYLCLEPVHQAVNWRVYEALLSQDGPVQLVGYSLGSIVCYCALSASRPLAQKVSQLLMVGSPLFWFHRAVARRADLARRPAVGYFCNLAGILDVAWPQAVPRIAGGLDEHEEFVIDRSNPIRGHHAYFTHPESLRRLACSLRRFL